MNNTEWKELTINRFGDLAKASNTLHHAAQFIAYAGKHLIREEPDDSHTSAVWVPEKNLLAGQPIKSVSTELRVALHYPSLILMVTDKDLNELGSLEMNGKTKPEALAWLKNQLRELGLDVRPLTDKIHFEIPSHEVENGGVYKMDQSGLFAELARYRTNGHLVLTHFAEQFDTASPVLVWPHHFDEGSYIPLQFESGETITSVSIGLAVPDNDYDSPYFYVTAWKKDGLNYKNKPEITSPGHWHQHEWTEQVLEGKSLTGMDKNRQRDTAFAFMKQALENVFRITGIAKNLK
ncbi:MAG: hypothetical protein GXO86_04680 [Chlorobi bacterium]|nr:hypothetical protein [Chlorobiota bacterium]